ncbi:MAG: serine/threonine protein kinase [Myxococcales bacterium]|nr:serine/threonine protein kinase [Myxococcales bacterium]
MSQSGQSASTAGTTSPLSPGSLVGGRFQVEDTVRTDGLGFVLRAQDQKTQKPILLRVLREDLFDDEGLKRLREECRGAARLAHRSIAATYGVGVSGGAFVASEWVDGHSLSEVLAKRIAEGRPLSLRGAYNVVAHVCRALTAAHARTCHGALRPEVVWVTSAGRVKVADFGLSKALIESRGPDALPPPEQAALAPEVKAGAPPTPRSDIFGVGAILYQLLTGKSPAEGFVPPSQAHPEASEAIDEVLLRCLATDPSARFGSADEVRSALQPLVADAPEANAHDFDVDIDIDDGSEVSSPVAIAPAPGPAAAAPPGAAAAPPAPAGAKVAPPAPRPPPPARPAPPTATPKPAAPKVGQRVGLDAEFRTSLPGPAPAAGGADVDLGGLLAKITENDAPRWMVVKDGLDHGPFSGRELVELIVKSEVLPEHVLLNMDDGDRRPVSAHPELGEFVEQARLKREAEGRKAALAKAETSEKRTGLAKAAIAIGVFVVLGAGVAIFFATRETRSDQEIAEADLGDLFQRGQIDVEGTAGILPDPPPSGGGMRRTGGGGARPAGGFHGSYEDAMNVPIDLGDATGGGSQARLSPADVASTMNRNLNRIFGACVQPELRRGGSLGNVTIDIAIAGNGTVMGVSARAGSNEFKNCVRTQVRSIRFPTFPAPRMGARYAFSAG